MKETFGLWSLLTVGSSTSMWISITAAVSSVISIFITLQLCSRGIAMSFRLSVRQTRALTKRKQLLPGLLYRMQS